VTSGVEEMVDGVTEGEVRSEKGNYRLFSNVTTVLPYLGPLGGHAAAFSGSEEQTRDQALAQRTGNGKTAA
jgi:hypothetical protein